MGLRLTSTQRGKLSEKGASGHLMHLHENHELTFAELKGIIAAAAARRLTNVTEKLDGMSLVFTWDGSLRVARSGKDIAAGGKDAAALAAQFEGHRNPKVQESFVAAFKVLNKAMQALSTKVAQRVFRGGDTWYSIEIIAATNPNVIQYDKSNIVFHNSPVFDVRSSGVIEKLNDGTRVRTLTEHIDTMQAAVNPLSWSLCGPSVPVLRRVPAAVVTRAREQLQLLQACFGASDSDTVGDFLRNVVRGRLADLNLCLSDEASEATVSRIVKDPGAPGLPQIKKLVSPDKYEAIRALVERDKQVVKEALAPIELVIHEFAVELLRGCQSSLVHDHQQEVSRLRAYVNDAIEVINSSNDDRAKSLVFPQTQKLGDLKNIDASMEGIVFIHKGQTYKLTGSFAPMNQIIGLFKHGRSGVRLDEQKLLRSHSV